MLYVQFGSSGSEPSSEPVAIQAAAGRVAGKPDADCDNVSEIDARRKGSRTDGRPEIPAAVAAI